MVEFVKVAEHFDRIAVVGTGQSLQGVKLRFPSNVAVIAVNGAIHILDRVDFWFTLDPSIVNKKIMSNTKEGIIYYAAVPPYYGNSDAPKFHMRELPEKGINYLLRIEGNSFGRCRARKGLPDKKNMIHTGNSGWGGFQLAVHMSPRKVALFGLDGQGSYAYGGRPRNLRPMPHLFASATGELNKRKINVINGSPISTITCFKKMEPLDALNWLAE